MSERYPRLQVVGGREYRPDTKENIPNVEDSPGATPHQLLTLFSDVVGKMPANFSSSVNINLLKQYTEMVRSYTCGQLFNYLSHPDIWIHPTFTRATLDEIVVRRDIGNYSPRNVLK